jgi:hypothetical protein
LFREYQFSSAVDCFRFPHPKPTEYVPFAGLILLRPMRLVHLSAQTPFLGVCAFVFAIMLTAASGIVILRRSRTLLTRTVFLFSSFSFLFVVETAIGRVCLGSIAALASRYVPYVVPLWLAAYFTLVRAAERSRALRWCAGALVAALVAQQALVPDDVAGIRWYSEGKRRWRACFREIGDEAACNSRENFRVYPRENAPQVVRTMQFLRENRLNLFKP